MYATSTNLEDHLGTDRYVDLTDRDRAGVPDLEGVGKSLAHASSLADSYIARYLPLGSVPDALKKAVLDIATYDLAGNAATEDERKRYEDALLWLRDVGKGNASLGLPEGAIDVPDGEITVEAPEAQFAFEQTRRVL